MILSRPSIIQIIVHVWNLLGIVSGQFNPNFVSGRTTIVQLFEWRWSDVEKECVRFLGPKGFGGVQVSPASENVVIHHGDIARPWWERYQPVSYKIATRSGNQMTFMSMVDTCNRVGVRIYVDITLNDMSGQGKGKGTGGSSYDTAAMTYDGVPYTSADFNSRASCPSASGNIENYQNPVEVRNCKLSGLNDLNTTSPYVRSKLAEYLNRLIGFGVAGFRFDAAKHIPPNDIQAIVDQLNNLPTEKGFNANYKPFIYQEVIDFGGQPIKATDYTGIGRVTEFNYGNDLGEVIRKDNNQLLKNLNDFGEGWGFLPSNVALVFLDNHDSQRDDVGGDFVLTFRSPKQYKQAATFMLAWPYGVPVLMSSYDWPENIVNGVDENSWMGPPHDANYNIDFVTINSVGSCEAGRICEHRWKEIYQMVAFRNAVDGTNMQNWWDNRANQIAFCRGNKGFFALNNDNWEFDETLQTCLPAGKYCDLITGGLDSTTGSCIGKAIQVNSQGQALIEIPENADAPFLALILQAKAT